MIFVPELKISFIIKNCKQNFTYVFYLISTDRILFHTNVLRAIEHDWLFSQL